MRDRTAEVESKSLKGFDMLASLILVLEFVRLALELRDGVPASRADRVILVISILLIILALAEVVG